jgi:hypothetical protein
VTEDPFVAQRSLLFTVAYEMLGPVVDTGTRYPPARCSGERPLLDDYVPYGRAW